MTSLELLKEIEAWLSFNTEPSKEETAKLRKFIKEHVTEQLRIHDVSGSLGFNKGYEQGYNDATKEACQEIAKNYQPNDR
jgi:flagellar biosynthesis/type III secretory pathway protein FliH